MSFPKLAVGTPTQAQLRPVQQTDTSQSSPALDSIVRGYFFCPGSRCSPTRTRVFSTLPRRNQHSQHAQSPSSWENDPNSNITTSSQINEAFEEALRQIVGQFRAPIRYAVAYGSGVLGQKNTSRKGGPGPDWSPHPDPPKAVVEWQKSGAKMIDFIFGVSHTQQWHDLNLAQHPCHYSGLRYLPYASAAISRIQDSLGAGVYFNPYITVNGTMIKYGVVNLDTLAADLSEWRTLYLAGRLQKPVKILRDDPRVRLASQVNLASALRLALLMLPERFTERQLYERIAGLSYIGDPRMNSFLSGENPNKVSNIVRGQLPSFRQLYAPLMNELPNLDFNESSTQRDIDGGNEDGLSLQQDMDPVKRGDMVLRLPRAFRRKLYDQYKKFGVPANLDNGEAGEFEQRIATHEDLPAVIGKCVRATVAWPSTIEVVKGVLTSGVGRSWRYFTDKRKRSRER